MRVEPYLDFEGRCEEALEFYKQAVGAEVTALMRYTAMPDRSMVTPGLENKVMHAVLKIGESVVMASDGHNTGKANFHGIALTITAETDADARRCFDALAEGGQVNLALGPTFFASSFGMLADKFGVGWMVITPPAMPG